jgi:4-hydroxy-2-oxoheptanedioate aldolase
MQPSFVLQKIKQGGTAVCAKACYHDPELVELIASSGVDAVWICLEHRRINPSVIYSLIQACRIGGADAFIRVKPSNHSDLLYLLESGARGVMLPKVSHPNEVREVVAMMKFPPLGSRGYDGIHADSDFGRRPAMEYIRASNGESFLAVQIEEPEVVPYIDEIAAMPGVDMLFVGPGDLALGLGKFGHADDSEVRAIVQQVADACRRHGKVAGIPCAPEQVNAYREIGYRFVNVISDYRCVVNGLKAARAATCAAMETVEQR